MPHRDQEFQLSDLEKAAFPDHSVSLIELRASLYAEKLGQAVPKPLKSHIDGCDFCRQEIQLLLQSDPILSKSNSGEVKKGDVVFVTGWNGVVGTVLFYDKDREEIELELPKILDLKRTQNFCPVKPGDIEVLSPKEVLEKTCELFAMRLTFLRTRIVQDADKRINAISLWGFF